VTELMTSHQSVLANVAAAGLPVQVA